MPHLSANYHKGLWICSWYGLASRSLLGGMQEGFGEDVAVAGGEGDAAEGGEGWGDIGGRDGLEVLAGLDAEAHQQDGNMLVVYGETWLVP